MDPMYLSMMQTTQSVSQTQGTASAEQTSETGSSFRDLMEQQKVAGQTTVEEDGALESTLPEKVVGDALEEGEELISPEQMLAAALAVMQNPVVVTVEEPVAEASVPQTVGAVAESSVGQLAQPAELETVELPVEEHATAVQQTSETPVQPMEEQPAMTERTAVQTQTAVEAPQTQERPVETTPEAKASQMVEEPEAAGETVQQTLTVEQTVENESQNGASLEQNQSDEPEQDWEVSEHVVSGESRVFQTSEPMLIKVGETEGGAETASVTEQVSDQITTALEQGDSRVTVRLNPESLGTIDVELVLTEDGTLQVALHAENSKTQRLLERELSGLQNSLMRGTDRDVQVQVTQSQENQQNHNQREPEDGGQPHHGSQQQKQQHQHSGEDFLQQLRLGLLPLNAEEL